MNENRVEIIITTDGSGAVTGYKMVGDIHSRTLNQMKTETASATSWLKQNWLEFTAAAAGAYLTLQKGWQYLEMGAKAEQAAASFHQVTESMRIDGQKMLADMQRVSHGMIDDSALMQKGLQGLMLGLNDQQVVNLLEASRTAAKTWGQDVESTFDTVVTAVGGGVRAMGPLVRMGLITKDQFLLLNKAIAAGIEDIDLYGMVMANSAVQMARFSNEELDAYERTQQFNAAINETKESIGSLFGAGFKKFMEGWEIIGATAASGVLKLKTTFSYSPFSGHFLDDLKQIDQNYAATIGDIQKKWGDGPPRFDDKTSRQAKADQAKKDLEDMVKHIKAMTDAAANKSKIQEFSDAMAAWGAKIQSLDPTLDQTTREMMALRTEADKLRAKFGDKAWISEGLAKGLASLTDRKAMEDYLKDYDLTTRIEEAADKNRMERQKALEQALIDEWEQRQRIKENIQEQFKLEQAELDNQLALLDIAEKEHALSPIDLTRQRIALERQRLNDFMKIRAGLDPGEDINNWISIGNAISSTQRKLLDYTETEKELTGTFTEGLVEGMKRYLDTEESAFQGGLSAHKAMTQGMKNDLSSFLDYAGADFMSFGKLATSVIHDIYMELLRVLMIQPFVKGLESTILGWRSPGSSGGATYSGSFPALEGIPVPAFAAGGYVDKRTLAIVGEVPEVIIPVSKIMQSDGGRGSINVEVNVENKSSTPLDAKKGPVQFDGKKYIIGVVLEDWEGYGPIRRTIQP